MQIKKFRAATMREALEKVKQELGEDAFVLEAKQVRSKGILGFGSEMQVEVSAAPAPKNEVKDFEKHSTADSAFVGLIDREVAAPVYEQKAIAQPAIEVAEVIEESSDIETLRNALINQQLVARGAPQKTDLPKNEATEKSTAAVAMPQIELARRVEISEEAPRIIHAKSNQLIENLATQNFDFAAQNAVASFPELKENFAQFAAVSSVGDAMPTVGAPNVAAPNTAVPTAAPIAAAPAAAVLAQAAISPTVELRQTPIAPTGAASSFAAEFDRLRAELREVKFTLGTFAAQQTAAANHAKAQHSVQFEINESPFREAYLELLLTGMAADTAARIIGRMRETIGEPVANANELAYAALLKELPNVVGFTEDPLRNRGKVVMAMVGSTGVGKTTTVAKLAARIALRERRRVELVTLDTYRIAAVDQLKTYAEIIGANCHVVRSTLELDAILSRTPDDAHVLIDTTGRSPHDLSDQFDLSNYLREREDILKCLVLQATTHQDDAVLSAKKFGLYGANCLALTKLDETARTGATVEVARESGLPLIYLCSGQRVPEDLEQASAESLAARILPLLRQNRKFAVN